MFMKLQLREYSYLSLAHIILEHRGFYFHYSTVLLKNQRG